MSFEDEKLRLLFLGFAEPPRETGAAPNLNGSTDGSIAQWVLHPLVNTVAVKSIFRNGEKVEVFMHSTGVLRVVRTALPRWTAPWQSRSLSQHQGEHIAASGTQRSGQRRSGQLPMGAMMARLTESEPRLLLTAVALNCCSLATSSGLRNELEPSAVR